MLKGLVTCAPRPSPSCCHHRHRHQQQCSTESAKFAPSACFSLPLSSTFFTSQHTSTCSAWLRTRGGGSTLRRLSERLANGSRRLCIYAESCSSAPGRSRNQEERWASSLKGTSTNAAARRSHGGQNGTPSRGSLLSDNHTTALRAPAPSTRLWTSSKRSRDARACCRPSRTR